MANNPRSSDADVVRQRLSELVDDLRVALPGAEKGVYFLAFTASVHAAVLLIAPSACHRVYHELHDPGGLESLLRVAGFLAVAGASFLALSMTAVVFLITDTLYQRGWATAVAAGLLGVVVWTWFALPIVHRLRY